MTYMRIARFVAAHVVAVSVGYWGTGLFSGNLNPGPYLYMVGLIVTVACGWAIGLWSIKRQAEKDGAS